MTNSEDIEFRLHILEGVLSNLINELSEDAISPETNIWLKETLTLTPKEQNDNTKIALPNPALAR
jgi:hypothetical protein